MDHGRISYGSLAGAEYTKIEKVKHFDASRIFDCGQCFRFEQVAMEDGAKEWAGVAHGRYVSLRQEGDCVTLFGAGKKEFEDFFYDFLDLGTDYEAVNADILSRSGNPQLKEALTSEDGIRILRQEPWEALCSFIISQNNNIPRIKSLVSALCKRAGKPAVTTGMAGHGASEYEYSFPEPEAVLALGEEGLKELKTGFRAGYIYAAAKAVCDGSLSFEEVTAAESTAGASAMLCTLRGVGPKVAACALLFGFGRKDAFPIDVWVKRIIAKYFGDGFDPADLGSYAGVAQQYLFRYERGFGDE